MASRYIIGIDLGTTNIAVAYLDSTLEDQAPQVFMIPQVTNAGEVDSRSTLPSFLYLPDANEVAEGALDLPWATGRDFCVGAYARKTASTLPGKTVSSSKSWLCAANVDRLAPILPYNRNNPDRQLSPVSAAQRCLEHLRDAWNHAHAGDPEAQFEHQELVLTVPASFDAVARDLTVQAAQGAGLHVTLLEEPQAAFYAWLEDAGDAWRERVTPGEQVLVCDIGGGTTDFSLIQVDDAAGNLELRRIAVGDHILLGGDNMDLTLAYSAAAKLQQERNTRLDSYQLAGLTHGCREAKETLCADASAPPQRLTVLGRGSSLLGGTITTELSVDDIQRLLLDGFFPACAADAQPEERARGGLRAFGLSYASDPAITRHLAWFVARHCRGADGEARYPSAVLFNGGVTKAAVLQARVTDTLSGWAGHEVKALAGGRPDLGVAIGACWYGNVRRGNAIRIKAGSAHSYYVGIESTMPAVPGFEPPMEALCVVPFGMEEGTEAEVPYSGLGLLVGDVGDFRFFVSPTRKDDEVGEVLPDSLDPDLHELPALSTRLPVSEDGMPPGTLVPVALRAVLSEIGTLQLWCHEINGEHRWKLEFDLRDASSEGSAVGHDDDTMDPEPEPHHGG